jgi:hypothetical protein
MGVIVNKQSMVMLGILGCVGCGSSERSASEKCDDLIEDLCTRAVECIPNGGTKGQCIDAFRQIIPCASATSVSNNYDRCISQINKNSCSTLFPVDPVDNEPGLLLPSDCGAVINGVSSGGAIGSVFDLGSELSSPSESEP